MRTLTLRFEDKDFKKLKNMAEEGKILKKWSSWETFILNIAKIRQSGKEVRARK